MLDTVDKGRLANESEAMRKKREAIIAKSPPPQPFRLRAEMLKQGRSNQKLAATDNMWLNIKVYASGGENGLHNHTDEDHFHLVLSGSACFLDRAARSCIAGNMRASCCRRAASTASTRRAPAARAAAGRRPRSGCRGRQPRLQRLRRPAASDSKENGRVDVVRNEGVFWGARAK